MRAVHFSERGFEDLAYFVETDRKLAARLIRIIAETACDPFDGIGKPEPLRGDLAGHWSRRLNDEHRVVYSVSDDAIRVIACRFHYGR